MEYITIIFLLKPSRKKDYSSRASAISASQKEQDDIERAIELSLQENKQSSPRNTVSHI